MKHRLFEVESVDYFQLIVVYFISDDRDYIRSGIGLYLSIDDEPNLEIIDTFEVEPVDYYQLTVDIFD